MKALFTCVSLEKFPSSFFKLRKNTVLYLYTQDERSDPKERALRGLDPYSHMTFDAPERLKGHKIVLPSLFQDCFDFFRLLSQLIAAAAACKLSTLRKLQEMH